VLERLGRRRANRTCGRLPESHRPMRHCSKGKALYHNDFLAGRTHVWRAQRGLVLTSRTRSRRQGCWLSYLPDRLRGRVTSFTPGDGRAEGQANLPERSGIHLQTINHMNSRSLAPERRPSTAKRAVRLGLRSVGRSGGGRRDWPVMTGSKPGPLTSRCDRNEAHFRDPQRRGHRRRAAAADVRATSQ